MCQSADVATPEKNNKDWRFGILAQINNVCA